MRRVLRRVHTPHLYVGRIELDQAGSRHARDVLRLEVGTEVEIFDDAGSVARGIIAALDPLMTVQVDSVTPRDEANVTDITVAAAVPKGDRADWMIEKLSELGVARFIPLATARSVVLPEGKNKRERWVRLATESAKQSRRRGVMRIDELTKVADATAQAAGMRTMVLSTDAEAKPVLDALMDAPARVTLFIGPEGGWTDDEIQLFQQHDVSPVKLTDTILRVETAALVAAAVVSVSSNRKSKF
ncbi:MAG: rRNA (uracil1498-N3)-methyltransferase [Phycisphaerales bacterium]|jgi:16S rRNA (uracil1498-N3)-methyltransferase|nr:rRNA (uracil1498-N3)-methyltransferase [Phycisphaerales bacterium]